MEIATNSLTSPSSGSTEHITDEAANEEHVPIHSNDPLLSVLDLENTKTSQAVEIAKLKESVKKLERRNKSRSPGLKRLRKVGRNARIESSKDEGLGDQEDASKQGRKIVDLDADAEEVEVEKVVSTTEVTTASATTTIVDELTLAQTLIEIKAAKPKAVTTAATTTTTAVTRPKARGVVVQEPKPEKPLKKKDQILIDEEIAQKLQAQLNAELEEEEKLAKQREEDANIAEWDNIDLFVSIDSEVVKGDKEKDEGSVTRVEEISSKRASTELEQERIKKKKIDDDQEEAEMKKHIADGSSRRYSSMIKMLQNIDREVLETLWKLVKAKHGNTRPDDAYERVLWGDLKVMFEPHIESKV
ncbi:hypothetical protein Tco_0872095 [Tanacetum coccineum]